LITKDKLIHVDQKQLFDILILSKEPLMEAQLLKEVFSLSHIPSSSEELFLYHFSLYHALYLLKRSSLCDEFILTIYTMGISLNPKNDYTFCQYYDYEKDTYCNSKAEKNQFCLKHSDGHSEWYVVFDPLRRFYEDPENVLFGNSELLARGMGSIFLYIAKKDDVHRAFKFFQINEKTINGLKKKYRDIAKKYHPDINLDDGKKMKLINYYYELLKDIYLL